MSSSESGVRLRATTGAVALRLSDHQLQPVAEGIGELEKGGLAPGLYLLELDAGTRREERYLTLKAGEIYTDLDLELPFPSAVPMGGTTTSHEYHAYPASDLSRNPNVEYGQGGRLLVFARHLAPPPYPPVDLAALRLLGHDLKPVGDLGRDAVRDLERGWAGLCANVAPGGYVLRAPLIRAADEASSAAGRSSWVDQPLWVAAGWTTLLFLPCVDREPLPVTGLASVLMARASVGFRPYWAGEAHASAYEGPDQRLALAADLALAGLRHGKPLVPPDLLDLLLAGKLANPMLGILGAHVLLQARQPDWPLLDTVLENLARLPFGDPEHPDLAALRAMTCRRRDRPLPPDQRPVGWPPMVAAGYRALIAEDAAAGADGVLADDSVAERAAVGLLATGPWSQWRALEEEAPAHPPLDLLGEKVATGPPTLPAGEGALGPGRPLGTRPPRTTRGRARWPDEPALRLEPGAEALLRRLASAQSRARSLSASTPEIMAVREYLEDVGRTATPIGSRRSLHDLGPRDLARRLGLPLATVERAVAALVRELPEKK